MIGKRLEYEAMAECEKELWWYRCLHELSMKSLKGVPADARILDAGCGTGGLLQRLELAGYTNLEGFDLSEDALEFARLNTRSRVSQLDITALSQRHPAGTFDVIISHDIICLLNDEAAHRALSGLIHGLKPGGMLLLNLPAGKAFSGTHDKAVGIQRRYSRRSLRALLSDYPVRAEFIFWPFLLSPIIFSIRSWQRLTLAFTKKADHASDVKLPPRWLNRFFHQLTKWEIDSLKARLWGSSIFTVITKNR